MKRDDSHVRGTNGHGLCSQERCVLCSIDKLTNGGGERGMQTERGVTLLFSPPWLSAIPESI